VDVREAISVAEARFNDYLFSGAGSACEARVPDEVEDALMNTLVVSNRSDHLREIVKLILTIRIALILNMGLVLSTLLVDTLVAFIEDHLEAAMICVMVGSHVDDATTEVLEDSEVVELVQMVDGVESGLLGGVRVEERVALDISN
jgi:hypothetical protein